MAPLHTADPLDRVTNLIAEAAVRSADGARGRVPQIDPALLERLAPRVTRRAAYTDLVAAILPGLRGDVETAAGDLAPDVLLRAALVTWSPSAPVTTPGILPPQPPLRATLMDLLPTVEARSVLRVPKFTPAAPAQMHAVGGPKVETVLAFGPAADAYLRSVGTHIGISDELLDDADQLRAWLELYLEYLVALGEEKAVLLGNGVAPNLLGYFSWPGIAAYAGSATTIVGKLAAMAAQASASGIEPDTYVLNLADWASVLAEGDTTLDADASTLHGRDVIRTGALAAGQMLVGAVQSASAVGRSEGIRVEGTQSHDVEFVKNISRIRAASRLALGVTTPTAFVKVG